MAYNNYGNRIHFDTPIVINIIIINVLVFVAQNLLPQLNIQNLGALHYYTSSDFKPYQFVTGIFLHANFGHLLFNMLALYFFGTILERYWGPKRFLIFYLVCGIGASLIIELTIPFTAEQFAKSAEALQYGGYSVELKNAYMEQYAALGASGAIMGIMAAFVWLFPNTELYIMFIPVPVKAKYVIPVYILMDLFGGFYKIKGDNIAHFAHLGGALIGFLFVIIWNKTNKKTFY